MKKNIFVPHFICLFILLNLYSETLLSQITTDSVAIKETSLNYMLGWYTGNAERMAKALHPDLIKRSVRNLDSTGAKQVLNTTTADAMIMTTSLGFGKKQKGVNGEVKYELLDANGYLAMVKLTTVDYTDYLQLAKINSIWKIINVLWMNTPKH